MISTHPDESEILRQPGYLYWEPTNLSSEALYGDLLGFTESGVEIIPDYSTSFLAGECYGVEPVIGVYIGCWWKVRVVFKNWNNDVIARCFPGINTSNYVQYPASVHPGLRIDVATYAKHLLFSPLDQGEHNMIFLAQMAVGSLVSPLPFKLDQDTMLEALFHCFRKGSGSEDYRGVYLGPMSEATLL